MFPTPLLAVMSVVFVVYVLVRGPQWARLWLLTIIGCLTMVGMFAVILAATSTSAP